MTQKNENIKIARKKKAIYPIWVEDKALVINNKMTNNVLDEGCIYVIVT